MVKVLPKCMQEKFDCFAIVDGTRCNCLNNTKFGDRECPFYKKAEKAPAKDGPIEFRQKEGGKVTYGYQR